MKTTVPTKLLALFFFSVSGCESPNQERTQADNKARSIVSLSPNLTEILFDLGLGEQIVGVTIHCTQPPAAETKEKIGDFLNPNLEKIISLDPDLIVAERWPSSRTVPQLKRFGLQVFETISPKSLLEIFQTIRELGQIVNRAERAEDLVREMQSRFQLIQKRSETLSHRPSVYVEIDLPSWTIGKNSFVTEALEVCGFRNLFDDMDRPALEVSKEVIVSRNPDVILSFTVSAAEMRERPGWTTIQAVKKGFIIDTMDEGLLSRGNHRLVEGMEQLQRKILEMLDGN